MFLHLSNTVLQAIWRLYLYSIFSGYRADNQDPLLYLKCPSVKLSTHQRVLKISLSSNQNETFDCICQRNSNLCQLKLPSNLYVIT